MPYFAQEPLSYLTLPTIRNAYKTFSIKVNFRPDNVDGERRQADFCLVHLDNNSVPFFRYLLCLSCFHMFTFTASRVLPPVPHLSWWEGLILYAGESQRSEQEVKCDVDSPVPPLHQTVT